ncbi:hypothetical protein BUALT_Bualt07G0075800 [Buddleja alternifolia]|uniref:Uncharacterized protein n=1 Tax=Buddleja alternifolia TaxID=168488 RepID=A0AAV6XFJ2_9LAMI|nr:hypothetical protein BUALT_Bualt07G0075800 [Buddleja alternifolia]
MCPTDEDWEKVEKVISVLESFWTTIHIISGSDYPTSNLFLNDVSRVKELLDKKSSETDDFIQNMVVQMKKKFDKYWGECNLLMSIASVLDPRCKMRTLEFCFPKLYSPQQVAGEISKHTNSTEITKCGWSEFAEYVRSVETTQPQKSELDMYLEENCYMFERDKGKDGGNFDVRECRKIHAVKYRILSTMAKDILAIPITTVTSEAAFSAGSRVNDKYRASLSSETMCGGDWLRKRFGSEKKSIQVILPADDTKNG